jgi:hypothetical protein
MSQFALNEEYEDIPDETAEQVKRHRQHRLFYFCPGSNARYQIKKCICRSAGKNKDLSIRNLSFQKLARYFTALIRYPDFMVFKIRKLFST